MSNDLKEVMKIVRETEELKEAQKITDPHERARAIVRVINKSAREHDPPFEVVEMPNGTWLVTSRKLH